MGFQCGTRALKNAKFIQKAATRNPSIKKTADEFLRTIPPDLMARLHTISPKSKELTSHPELSTLMSMDGFPAKSNNVRAPLFNGTLYFVQMTFNNTPAGSKSICDGDMQTIINYASDAVDPISQYATQYGGNNVHVNQDIINYPVDLQGNNSYSTSCGDATLQKWVEDIVHKQGLSPKNSCIIILHPDTVTNNWAAYLNAGGYHYITNTLKVPYIFGYIVNYNDGDNLTIQDPKNHMRRS